MRAFYFFAVLASALFGDDEITALYLSWYGDPTTTMTIQWHTPEDSGDAVMLDTAEGWVRREGSHKFLEEAQRFVHTVTLSELKEGTEYNFRIGDHATAYRFRTMPETLEKPVRFLIGGDAFSNTKLFRKMNQSIASHDPEFVVIGGDIAYAIHYGPVQHRSFALRRWLAFLAIWKEQMISPEGRLIPFLLVPGNHDLSSKNGELFFNLFAFPEKQLYRAVDFGRYLSLILLDTGHFQPIEGKQTRWLEKALRSREDVTHCFPIYHVAAYPACYPYSGGTPKTIRNHWCPLFDQHQIAVVFEHHNHAYKRTFPIRAGKVEEGGTVYLGDGAWGVNPRKTHNEWYLEKKAKKNCVWVVEMFLDRAKFKAVDLGGKVFDEIEVGVGAGVEAEDQ